MTTHPRIGIRPTIDGRRKGVRGVAADQTMGMARPAVADLLRLDAALPGRRGRRVRHRGHHDRARQRGRRMRPAVP